jgi:ABC-type nitrate/sulfonate/bicarbonate transport system permease component
MRNVPQSLCEVARVMGASRMYVVRKVVLPSAEVPLFAAIVIIVAMVVAGYAIIGFFERRALAWQQK